MSSTPFLTTLHIQLGIPHLMVEHLSWCQCFHTINDLGIHLLHCPCRNEHIAAHNTLWNTIATIALENGTHIQKEVSRLFSYHTWKWVDIIITRNGFQTLVNIIIVNFISYKFGVICFDDDNACNNNYHSKLCTILHRAITNKWFHSPCHKDLWLSPSSFWFLFTSYVRASIACH
jgi:hypothetical protein